MKMMYNCREMVDFVSMELDRKLPLFVRMRMAMHLSMCKNCRNYRDQISHVEKLIETYYSEETFEMLTLSDEIKSSIESTIEKYLDSENSEA